MVSVKHVPAQTGRKASFQVRWRDLDGHSRSKSLHTLSEAKSFAAEVRVGLDTGTYRDDRKATLTFQQYAEQWLASSSGGAAYKASRASLLANHVYPEIGDERLVDLTPQTLREVVAGLRTHGGKKMARSSAASVAQCISAILTGAADDGLISVAPIPRRWPLPERQAKRTVFLEYEEGEALVAATEEYWRPLVQFLLDTGCRWGEAAGLTIDNVNLETGEVVFAASLSDVQGRLSLKSTKSGQARRVLLTERTRQALVDHLDAHGTGHFTDAVTGQRVDGLVFHGRRGAPVQRTLFRRRVFDPAVRLAGLQDRHPTPHSLRHTHASHLIAGGVDVIRVAARLGHSRPSVTTDVYSHLLAGSDASTVAALEQFRERSAERG